MLVAIYLDDIVVAYNCQSLFWSFENELTHKFKCKDLDEKSNVLKMRIMRTTDGGQFLLVRVRST